MAGKRLLQALGAVALASVAMAQGRVDDPLEVKVNSAIFTVRYQLNNGWALAPRGTKLLVLKYTVRNVGTTPREYSREAISIGIRKENGKRNVSLTAPARLYESGQIELKAGQSVSDVTWLEVPNDADLPKLNLRSNGVEKPLSIPTKIENQLGPFGKPGTLTALDEIEVPQKEEVKLGPWNIGLGTVKYLDKSPSFRLQAPSGLKYCLIDARFKNPLNVAQALTAYAMNWEAIGEDGTIFKWSRTLLDPDGEHLDVELGASRTLAGTLTFFVASSARLVAIRATDPSSGRSVLIKLK